jgi:hypothetical protein
LRWTASARRRTPPSPGALPCRQPATRAPDRPGHPARRGTGSRQSARRSVPKTPTRHAWRERRHARGSWQARKTPAGPHATTWRSFATCSGVRCQGRSGAGPNSRRAALRISRCAAPLGSEPAWWSHRSMASSRGVTRKAYRSDSHFLQRMTKCATTRRHVSGATVGLWPTCAIVAPLDGVYRVLRSARSSSVALRVAARSVFATSRQPLSTVGVAKA